MDLGRLDVESKKTKAGAMKVTTATTSSTTFLLIVSTQLALLCTPSTCPAPSHTYPNARASTRPRTEVQCRMLIMLNLTFVFAESLVTSTTHSDDRRGRLCRLRLRPIAGNARSSRSIARTPTATRQGT